MQMGLIESDFQSDVGRIPGTGFPFGPYLQRIRGCFANLFHPVRLAR